MVIKLLEGEILQKNQQRIKIGQLHIFQYCYFETLNTRALKNFVQILLAKIFETIN